VAAVEPDAVLGGRRGGGGRADETPTFDPRLAEDTGGGGAVADGREERGERRLGARGRGVI
jgi:hypothetical protein